LAFIGNADAARGWLIVASFLALSETLLGLALGIYTVIELLPFRGAEKV
jgi:hypothetical protein